MIDSERFDFPSIFGVVKSTDGLKRNHTRPLRAEVQEIAIAKYSDNQLKYVGDTENGRDFYGLEDELYYESKGMDGLFCKTIPWTKESVIKLYDQVCAEVNGSFKKFMAEAFHCLKSRAEVIKAGRESVSSTGLFITKKRYAVLYYDKEGERTDQAGKPGKMKAMGLDLK